MGHHIECRGRACEVWWVTTTLLQIEAEDRFTNTRAYGMLSNNPVMQERSVFQLDEKIP